MPEKSVKESGVEAVVALWLKLVHVIEGVSNGIYHPALTYHSALRGKLRCDRYGSISARNLMNLGAYYYGA